MGRGRIRAGFDDNVRAGGPTPDKASAFSSSSIPNADAEVFRELKAAVSKIESRVGIDLPQGNLGFTDSGDFLGVHFGAGDSRTVLLQRSFFNRPSKDIIADLRKSFKDKWAVGATTPLQYIVTHELGHSIWVDRVEGADQRLSSLNNSIRNLYKRFRRDTEKGRVPISLYARTNINEFVAETFVKGIIGEKQNVYSRTLLKLFRKNRGLLKTIR